MNSGHYYPDIIQNINYWLSDSYLLDDLSYQLSEKVTKKVNNINQYLGYHYHYDVEHVSALEGNFIMIDGSLIPFDIPPRYQIPKYLSESGYQIGNKLEVTGWFNKFLKQEIRLHNIPPIKSLLDWIPCFNSENQIKLINFNPQSKKYLFGIDVQMVRTATRLTLNPQRII